MFFLLVHVYLDTLYVKRGNLYCKIYKFSLEPDLFFPLLVTCFFRWFSPGSPVSSTNKTGRHDITDILLKLALDTITKNLVFYNFF
jgi:hypothetical protein